MPELFFGDELKKTVFIAAEQLQAKEPGPLYGRYYEDTRIFNVFPPQLQEEGCLLGQVLPIGSQPDGTDELSGVVTGEGIDFFSEGEKLDTETYGLYQSIFSRNKGILETDVMAEKRAVILGCGSVGSLIALELARAGVGHFLLADPDIIEYHNLCRHQCGLQDVGDLKINALARRLRSINPAVDVTGFEGIVQNLPKDTLDAFCRPGHTIFVGCADNRAADVYSNRISIHYAAAFISIGFWERAYAGEIFYHMPRKGMPCYACALGDGGGLSARAEASHHVYSNREDIEGVKFEPGISVDINFITSIGVKLILDILNVGGEDYTPRLLNDLKQYTLVCNTNNTAIGGEMVEIFSYPLQVTTSLMVDFGAGCQEVCKYERQAE